jgi:hypothetical protein
MATIAPAIREPSVDIFQQVAPTATPAAVVGMSPCCVAPNYQVVRAQDDDGNFRSAALMGTYEDLDETITYAVPSLEDGATLDDDSLRVWLKIGSTDQELDGESDEAVVVSSEADSVAINGSEFDLTDAIQDFVGSGVLASQAISGSDYVVRMLGTDLQTRDFPITNVASTVLTVSRDAEGYAPLQGVPPATDEYEVILNPTKFVVNAAAISSQLRVDTETATLTIPGAATPNGDLLYTAVLAGNDGNQITVEHVDGGAGYTPILVEVTNYVIKVTFDASADDASDIRDAVLAHAQAPLLVTPSINVDGLSTAAAAANLTGGSHVIYSAPTGGTAGDIKRIRYADGGALALSLVGNDLTITLNTGTTTDEDIRDAIEDPLDPAYDSTVNAWINAQHYGGIATPEAADLPNYTNLSGGQDADSVTLDGNLIGQAGISANVYVEYRALRLVYTASASMATTGNNPRLVQANNLTTLEEVVGEFSTDNPLGLMMYYALLNFPGGAVYGLGVDEVSESYPDGTDAAWQRAADFMISQMPYFMAIGSQRDVVHDIWVNHINLMNGDGVSTAARTERFLFINKETPTMSPDSLLGNGDDLTGSAGTYLASENFYLLGVAEDDILVVEDGSTGPYTLQNGLKGYYCNAAAVGSPYQLTIKDPTPLAYPNLASDTNWAIYNPGSALQTAGVWDKNLMAETVNQLAQQISNRKVSYTFPDNVTVTIDGAEQSIAGYYRDAMQIGQCAAQPPQQSKYRQSLTGAESLRFSGDFFTGDQLDLIQGGGVWVYYQPIPNGAVVTRHSLTTDVSNALTRNPTCSWQVDKYCRAVRTTTQRSLGPPITPALLSNIGVKIEAVGRFSVEKGQLASAGVDSIEQGDGVTADYDEIVVRGEASPLLPNNGIKYYVAISA